MVARMAACMAPKLPPPWGAVHPAGSMRGMWSAVTCSVRSVAATCHCLFLVQVWIPCMPGHPAHSCRCNPSRHQHGPLWQCPSTCHISRQLPAEQAQPQHSHCYTITGTCGDVWPS